MSTQPTQTGTLTLDVDTTKFELQYKVFSHWVEWAVYEYVIATIVGVAGSEHRLYKESDGCNIGSEKPVHTFLTTRIKWDGCSDSNLGHEGYFHYCDRSGLAEISAVLTFAWNQTSKLLTTFQGHD